MNAEDVPNKLISGKNKAMLFQTDKPNLDLVDPLALHFPHKLFFLFFFNTSSYFLSVEGKGEKDKCESGFLSETPINIAIITSGRNIWNKSCSITWDIFYLAYATFHL